MQAKPKIEATVFADANFFNQELQPSDCKLNSESIVAAEYDLVIDIATLWRTGVFRADNEFQYLPNSVIIRSSHFTEHDCRNDRGWALGRRQHEPPPSLRQQGTVRRFQRRSRYDGHAQQVEPGGHWRDQQHLGHG